MKEVNGAGPLGEALVDEVKDFAIYRLDTHGHILYWNEGAQILKGYGPEEIRGRHFSIFYTAEDRAAGKPECEMEMAARDGRYEDESWRVRKDGSVFWGNEIITALHDPAGNLIGFIKIARDLTERKAMEDALRESNEQNRLLVENARDFAIFMMDPQGHIKTWNEGAQRIFRFTESEVMHRPGSILFTPEDIAKGEPQKELETARTEGRASDDRWQQRRGGERFWASGVTTAVHGMNGDLRGFAKVCRDLTETKHQEQERERLLKQEKAARLDVERAMTLRDEFLAVVSHELRTPLGAILLWVRLLRPMVTSKDAIQAVEVIQQSAIAQRQLINDLLDMSGMISGKLRLNVREVELGPAIEAAIDTVQPMAEAKGVEIEAFMHEDAGLVLADPDRIQQMVWNLLHNAVKFTPAGGRVTLRLGRIDGVLRIQVADTGIGITAQFLPHVFEPFRQADASTTRSEGGLGLGLAICRQLVELHGGTIRADSGGEGKGAKFTADLPLPNLQPKAIQRRVTSRRKAASVAVDPLPILEGVRVLVVEDDHSTREALRQVLEQSRAQVTAVESAARAIEALQIQREKGGFGVLISDIGMAGHDGYALIRQIRAMENQQGHSTRIPAIALTAYAAETDRQKAMAAGFQAFVAKPVEPEVVVAVVAAMAPRG